ncbi:MAG TPA: NAD(P)/FAD-dependent oxidoreductase, partial [Puia sp.]|nr:NAD(P)/FAD-dependent oxidoreductase [Puia sp.]
NQVSTKALFKEWNDEDEENAQYRIESGYQKMIDAIVDDCKKRGGNFLLNQRVRQITWKKNHVKLRTEGGEEFEGAKLIITVPLGILWLKPEEGGIQFSPAIDATLELTRKIGYGSVIKFLVQFHKPIWDGVGQGIGFFFADQSIPTWWTQEPKKDLLLTGWLGGPNASKYDNETDENLQHLVTSELQNAFDLDSSFLHNAIRNVLVFNWGQDAFARGAYSYPGIETDRARIELSKPIDGVLFFAGEALYDGDTGGTVEAALISGKKVAAELLKIF